MEAAVDFRDELDPDAVGFAERQQIFAGPDSSLVFCAVLLDLFVSKPVGLVKEGLEKHPKAAWIAPAAITEEVNQIFEELFGSPI